MKRRIESVFGAFALAIRRCVRFAEEVTLSKLNVKELRQHSVQELRQLAKELGVKGSSTMKKADLIAELEEAIS